MKFIGATDWFVRFPFIIEGIIVGVISAAISFGVMWGAYSLVSNSVENMLRNFNNITTIIKPIWVVAPIMAQSFLGFGIFIGGLGSYLSVRKHLKV